MSPARPASWAMYHSRLYRARLIDGRSGPEPPARLVQAQGFDAHDEIQVVFELTEEWGRTTLARRMIFPSNDYRDGMLQSGLERGSMDSYDALAQLLSEG